MTVRFNVKDLREHGLQIIGPLDPSFNGLVYRYFKGKPNAELEELKPFSVFISNNGNQDVVAYVIKWELVRADGKVVPNFTAYAQPGVLMGYGVGARAAPGLKHIIAPGSVRLFSWTSPIDADEGTNMGGSGYRESGNQGDAAGVDPSVKVVEQVKSQLRQSTSITVSLDGAFFEDGTFVGPNTSGYFERIKAEIDAKKDMLAEVASAVGRPGELDRVFDSIEARSRTEPPPLHLDSGPEALYRFYAQMFAREIAGLKDAYGKEKTTAHLLSLHGKPKPKLMKL